MKKLLSFVSIITILLSTATFTSTAYDSVPQFFIGLPYEEVTPIYGRIYGYLGDVNSDNKISIMDATKIQLNVAQILTFRDDELLKADTNGDKVISIIDSTEIQLWLAKRSKNKFISCTLYSDVIDFPYYDQTDYWHTPYGDGTIDSSGDAPTAFAMVVSYLTGTRITPADVVDWCGNSYYVYGYGTHWGFFGAAADHYNITLERFTTDINVVVEALAQGKPVINAQGAGRFTSGGHFIVLRGIDENGRILVYDPNNGDTNGNNASFSKTEISASQGVEEFWIFTSETCSK